MGKPQLTQLPNYQNYQNAIKVKTHIVTITQQKKKKRTTYSIDLNFQKNKSKQIP